jgi:hypothetical protein
MIRLRSIGALAATLMALGMAADRGLLAEEIGGPSSRLKVTVADDGRLTVDLGEVPLSNVLAQIAKDANAELEIRGDVARVRPQTFAGLPMTEGIRRLTGRNSSILWFGPADDGGSAPHLRRIVVINRQAGAEMTNRADNISLRAAGRTIPRTSRPAASGGSFTAVTRVPSYVSFAKLDRQTRLYAIAQLARSGGAGRNVLIRIAAVEKDVAIRQAAVAALAQPEPRGRSPHSASEHRYTGG